MTLRRAIRRKNSGTGGAPVRMRRCVSSARTGTQKSQQSDGEEHSKITVAKCRWWNRGWGRRGKGLLEATGKGPGGDMTLQRTNSEPPSVSRENELRDIEIWGSKGRRR